ncbi:MFS transporter [Brochothrix campestris]|uniref:Putative efflux transporter n=1 Tax=Brochothrix campestris FSL F6-1037 TaxID=1265861 RepID=W7CWQ6_9LIST|nr:MFS transporter [Brochothrix campestris]EUJ41170.1 putative efflux transporter [Brochothrix campestris FSL F6-1037]
MNTFSNNTKVTLLTAFLSSLVYGSTIPYLIIYLAKHVPTQLAGVIVMSNVGVSFVAGLIGGYLADHWQRKHILLVCQLCYAGGYFLMAAQLGGFFQSLSWLVVGYFIVGISFNLYYPAFGAIILDSSTHKNRKRVYQYEYWLFNLAMALGASIGGFAFRHYLLPLFILSGVVLLGVTLVIQLKLTYENAVNRRQKQALFGQIFANYAIVFKDKRWVVFMIGVALYQMVEYTLTTYTGVRLSQQFTPVTLFNQLLDGVRLLSVLQVINTVMVVGLTFYLSHLTKRLNERLVICGGLLLYVVGYGIMASNTTMSWLIILMVCVTVGELVATPLLNARQVDLIPQHKQASYLSFAGLGTQLSQLLAGFALTLGGFMSAGLISGYIIILGLVGISLVLFSLYRPPISDH